MDFDVAGAVEGEVFEADVLQRADTDAEIVVATEFEVGLVVEFEIADVGDAAQGDVGDGAVERGAVAETLYAGQQADGVGLTVRHCPSGAAGDVLDDDVLDGAVAGRVVFPLPGIERDVSSMRIAAHVADDAVAGRAVHMHAIASVRRRA